MAHTHPLKLLMKSKFLSMKMNEIINKKLAYLNAIVINILYCAFDENEFNRIYTYYSTKEI